MKDKSKVKPVLKKLEEIGMPGATVMDTIPDLPHASDYKNAIFSVVYNETTALKAIDKIATMLGMDESSDSGIIITIPLVGEMGLL